MPMKKIHLPNQCYFVTTNIENREWIFGKMDKAVYIPNDKLCQIVIDDLNFYRNKFQFLLYGYVIMPDHFHVIITVSNKGNISEIMRDIKSHTSYEINRILTRSGALWQEDFYEHCIRNKKDFEEKLNYMHFNPVRAHFVKDPADFKYSSYRNYSLGDDFIIKIDRVEL